jgi:hypothetical protein
MDKIINSGLRVTKETDNPTGRYDLKIIDSLSNDQFSYIGIYTFEGMEFVTDNYLGGNRYSIYNGDFKCFVDCTRKSHSLFVLVIDHKNSKNYLLTLGEYTSNSLLDMSTPYNNYLNYTEIKKGSYPVGLYTNFDDLYERVKTDKTPVTLTNDLIEVLDKSSITKTMLRTFDPMFEIITQIGDDVEYFNYKIFNKFGGVFMR